MSVIKGIYIQDGVPTPDKPVEVISIMVDEEGDKYIKRLQQKLQQKENIIKEVREYIKEHSTTINFKTMRADYNLNMNELLEILDKEVN